MVIAVAASGASGFIDAPVIGSYNCSYPYSYHFSYFFLNILFSSSCSRYNGLPGSKVSNLSIPKYKFIPSSEKVLILACLLAVSIFVSVVFSSFTVLANNTSASLDFLALSFSNFFVTAFFTISSIDCSLILLNSSIAINLPIIF